MFDINKEMGKKRLIITIVSVIVLVIAIVGITYAAWSYTFNGTQTNTLSTADISLELLESNDNIITVSNALPIDDASGKAQTNYFDFVVTSKTTRDIDVDYNITIEKLSVDTGYTSLNDNEIKIYLTNESNTQIVAPTLVSGLTNNTIYSSSHEHDSSHNKVQSKYRLRAWINQSVDASSWTSSTKLQYKFRLGVSGGEHNTATTTVYAYPGNADIGDSLSDIDGVINDIET